MQAYNPYLPSWEYIPDGEPHVYDGRVYVYGSHDRFRGHAYCLNDYVCWSAPVDDLADWRYEGVIFRRTDDPDDPDGEGCLFAPDVTRGPDGRYYLYYVLSNKGFVSVAVCDTPAGRYEFLGYVHYADGTRLGEREGDEPQFDPGVLTEGDVTYLYSGFCAIGDKSRTGSKVITLDKDMLTVIHEPTLVVPGSCYSKGTEFEGHAFFEASSIRKVNGKYYFIYSSEVMHELCYAVSDNPFDGFKYGGVLVSNTDLHIDSYKPADMPMCSGANNHGSIVQINDDWYIFYHRHTNNTWFSRQGCAEKLTLKADGSFPQVEMTSCGLNGGPLEGRGEYPAYLACNLFTEEHRLYLGQPGSPKIVQDGRDGDEETGYLAGISDGTTAGFKYFDCKGVKRFGIYTRAYCDGKFELRLKWDGEVLAEFPVKGTNVWEPCFKDVALPDGVKAIYLTYKGTGSPQLRSFVLE